MVRHAPDLVALRHIHDTRKFQSIQDDARAIVQGDIGQSAVVGAFGAFG